MCWLCEEPFEQKEEDHPNHPKENMPETGNHPNHDNMSASPKNSMYLDANHDHQTGSYPGNSLKV